MTKKYEAELTLYRETRNELLALYGTNATLLDRFTYEDRRQHEYIMSYIFRRLLVQEPPEKDIAKSRKLLHIFFDLFKAQFLLNKALHAYLQKKPNDNEQLYKHLISENNNLIKAIKAIEEEYPDNFMLRVILPFFSRSLLPVLFAAALTVMIASHAGLGLIIGISSMILAITLITELIYAENATTYDDDIIDISNMLYDAELCLKEKKHVYTALAKDGLFALGQEVAGSDQVIIASVADENNNNANTLTSYRQDSAI